MQWMIIVLCVCIVLQEIGIMQLKKKLIAFEEKTVEALKGQRNLTDIVHQEIDAVWNLAKELYDSVQLFTESEDESE